MAENVVVQVIPDYEKELKPREEATLECIKELLDENKVTDEVTRGRIYSKSKAFSNDVFIAGVRAGLFKSKA